MSATQDDWAPDSGQTIERLYVWVATVPDGGEGALAATVPGIGFTMLAGSDRDRVESYRDIAQETRRKTGYPIRLVCFTKRQDIEVLK